MSPWTLHHPKITDRFAELIAAKLSASGVAQVLNAEFGTRISRNAVIGKANRLALRVGGGRVLPDKEAREARRQETLLRARVAQSNREAREAARRQAQSEAIRKAEERERTRRRTVDPWAANDNAVPLMSRRHGQCAWPVGHAGRPVEQLCCGGKADPGHPYCTSHRAIGTKETVKAESFLKSMRRFL